MSIQNMAEAIKNAVDNRINNEARAMHGTIHNGRFISGGKSYPFNPAVDCNTNEGNRVWAQHSKNGDVVIVGE